MSPPDFTINAANQSTVLSLQSQVTQEDHVVSNRSGKKESTYGRNNSNKHVLEAAPTPQNLSRVFSKDYV